MLFSIETWLWMIVGILTGFLIIIYTNKCYIIVLEKETLKFFISTNTFFALSYYLNDNPLLFLEIEVNS